LQQLQDDYQQKSSRSQEDFNLKNSRGIEDYQQQRRRLLAEGKIFEANQLKTDFEQSQRRSQEDFNLAQSRSGLDVQAQIRKEGETSGFGLARVGRSALPLSRTQAAPGGNVPSTALAAPVGGSLTVQLILDGKTIAESSFADIEAMLMSQATIVLSSSPPKSASVSAVGGPRP
jgi:hypothetical protein